LSNSNAITEMLSGLPVADVVQEVRSALRTGNVLLHAEPGAGKSTGLPLALLTDASSSNRIVMLEPRRLAALGVAERLASQLGESLGQRIGLRMRGQTRVSKETILEVVTEGVLTRMLQADPTLDGIGLVIFDEFHERSLHADLGLALCLEVQQALRVDLKLLLMSATLDAEQLGEHLSGAEQVFCAGRQHPVNIKWLGQNRDELPVRVAAAVSTALEKEAGDILVFLPGVFEIDKTANIIEARVNKDVLVFRLHGRADTKTQQAATAASSDLHRRVILSTSIAETSITIDGVRVVIDAGLERRGRIDNNTGSVRLETVMASQASATQRSGRAGRTSSGVCYRLWSEVDHARRSVSWQAEILRSDLSTLLMELGKWGVREVDELPWLEHPPEAALARAESLLIALGIWDEGRLTTHGQLVAELPLHPRLGHMLLWACEQGDTTLACKLATLLEEDGGKYRGLDLDAMMQQPVSRQQQQRIAQLTKMLPSDVPLSQPNPNHGAPSVAILLAKAYPDWIAKRRHGAEPRYVLACGAGAFMSSNETLAHDEWLTVARMGGAGREARVFQACSLDIDELERWVPTLFSQHDHLAWDDRAERVIAEQHKMLGKLVVHTRTKTDVSRSEKAKALLAGIRQRGIGCLPWTEDCLEWQARVTMMRSLPEHGTRLDWPNVDNDALTANLDNWLLIWLEGKSNLKSLAQLNLYEILNTMLDYPRQQALDALLPRKYRVPSGSNITLRYRDTEHPVLSVKLQEMFGCDVNPSVANGHVTLKVELLSPARRPVQITNDLANFWTNSYPAVKKDLAGRYPKHEWPDNPLQTEPTAYAKRRKK